MLSLEEDLQLKKKSLSEFTTLSLRILNYLPNMQSTVEEKGDYKIFASKSAGTIKYLRPINKKMFISDPDTFSRDVELFKKILQKLKNKEKEYSIIEKKLINSVLYTIQQSIGVGLDLLVDPNSGRKHAGNRFEELMKVVFTEIGILHKKIVLKIPYDIEEGKQKNYVCENDIILTYDQSALSKKDIDEREIVVSIKTSSKDRMGKMFMDKILLEKFVGHNLKVIGIFLNDVQRKKDNNISFTLVSGLFMVYNKFLTSLEGVYYLDPPPNAIIFPYNNYIKPFSELVTKDIFSLLPS